LNNGTDERLGKETENPPDGTILLTGVLCGAAVGALIALFHYSLQIRSLESFRPSAITRVYSN